MKKEIKIKQNTFNAEPALVLGRLRTLYPLAGPRRCDRPLTPTCWPSGSVPAANDSFGASAGRIAWFVDARTVGVDVCATPAAQEKVGPAGLVPQWWVPGLPLRSRLRRALAACHRRGLSVQERIEGC
jgi:hypothetical protein